MRRAEADGKEDERVRLGEAPHRGRGRVPGVD